MSDQYLNVRTVAVIGAGVSGIAAAVHLRRLGLDVTVYERNRHVGGIWVYDDRIAKDASYPSALPSTGDSPEYSEVSRRFKRSDRQDSPMSNGESSEKHADRDLATSFAPPGPCYIALKNNVSTIEMEMTFQSWKPDTAEFVPHHVLAEYLKDGATANGIMDCLHLNTRVDQVRKSDQLWELEISQLSGEDGKLVLTESIQHFDALVVATGHYHACNIPDILGLSQWKEKFPSSVQHSKLYRRPDSFEGKNVLLVGAGVSSLDIARDVGPVANSVYQSSRGGMYDIPSHLLFDNSARIGAIKSFDPLSSSVPAPDGSIPGTITLQSGERLCGIHHIIICTGYHVSFPFMQHLHADGVSAEDANEEVLSTDGQQTHNLHKDIWYIPDPTLAFVGAPYHVATFSLFEFQAMAIAAVFSGQVPLPLKHIMRSEYNDRIERKGAGRTFHSLKAYGDEIAYVNDLAEMTTARGVATSVHSKAWHEAYERRCVRMKALFSQIRNPDLDRRVMEQVAGC